AGSPVWARSSGHKDELHIFLQAGLVTRVAAEAFDLDPARLTVPPLDAPDLPHLPAALLAGGVELTARGAPGPPAAPSLAHPPARHGRGPPPPRGRRGRPAPRSKAPRRRRVYRGTPRRRPEPGGAGRGRSSQRLPLRAAVQAGHRAAAAPVRHRPPRRAGQAA